MGKPRAARPIKKGTASRNRAAAEMRAWCFACTWIVGTERSMADSNYPETYRRLQKLAGSLGRQIPGPMGGFGQLHKSSLGDGRLPKKIKELMALGIAINSRCEGCVAYHVHDALRAGAEREEVLETIGVSLMMGGGPALIYGCEALEALEQFEASFKGSSAA
ncbi:MAG: carboxymuconolactone decarboxylase family protein [Bdellovibrionota bacterium]